MRTRSVASRLDRLANRGHAGDRERLIRELAEEYALSPGEVRAELEAIEEDTRRFGPSTIEQAVRRWAEELGLAEAEMWAEYVVITGASGGRP